MTRSIEFDGTVGFIERFDWIERLVHWTVAGLMGVLIGTAVMLFVPPVSAAVGRRHVVRDVHVYVGLALPLAVIAAAVLPAGRLLRRDVSRLNHWAPNDRAWLRSLGRRGAPAAGKFNGAQKLTASLLSGGILVMAATGTVMRWFGPFPLSWRTGATSVHDLTALFLTVLLVGHLGLALAHPRALVGMARGWVPARWAWERHPLWYDEVIRDQARRDLDGSRHAFAAPSATRRTGKPS